MNTEFLTGVPRAIAARGLSEATCRKYGYRIGVDKNDRTCQIADYRDAEGTLVAQKVRYADKTFSITGAGSKLPLFGQNLWAAGGKRLVITEGEIDAMSAAQAMNLSWPVVSLPNGANGAKKAIQNNLEYVESFDEVVLMFDMDDPGRAASAECAVLLSPGKARIAELPRKDANEMLKANEVKALVSAVYQARAYRPGGIINAADLWDKLSETQQPGRPYPWPGLTAMTLGGRGGTLTTWTAGTGAGKSSAIRQLAYNAAFPTDGSEPVIVGCVMLEESVARSAQGFLSQHLGKLVHVPDRVTPEELQTAFNETLATGRVWLQEHFGSLDSGDLLSKIRYLVVGCGCRLIVLDHVSIAVSGLGMEGDERKLLDFLMTSLRSLAEETGAEFHVISHLRRVGSDEGHEDGAQVRLSHLRGSQSIAQLSDVVVALERDLQGGDTALTTVRVLKNRTTGETGVAGHWKYSKETGRLEEVQSALGEAESERNDDF